MSAEHGSWIAPSTDGDLLVALTPDVALKVSAGLGKLFELSPDGVPRDRDLIAVRRLCAQVHRLAAEGVRFTGRGSEPGTGREGPVVEWLTTEQVAVVLGISSRAVTKRCCAGRVPGARLENNRWWIPSTYAEGATDDDEGNDDHDDDDGG